MEKYRKVSKDLCMVFINFSRKKCMMTSLMVEFGKKKGSSKLSILIWSRTNMTTSANVKTIGSIIYINDLNKVLIFSN